MAESIIVTVRKNRFCQDMELPSNLCLSELNKKLLESLKSIDVRTFGIYSSIILLHDGKALTDDTATLNDYGILTGFFIDVVEEE